MAAAAGGSVSGGTILALLHPAAPSWLVVVMAVSQVVLAGFGLPAWLARDVLDARTLRRLHALEVREGASSSSAVSVGAPRFERTAAPRPDVPEQRGAGRTQSSVEEHTAR